MTIATRTDSEIAQSLVTNRGNKTAAARELGLSRSAVYRWGKKNESWLKEREKWWKGDLPVNPPPPAAAIDVWSADKMEIRSTPTGSTRTLVRYERLIPKTIESCLKNFTDQIQWNTSPITPRLTQGDYVLELSLYDLHLGKYCWAAETGEDYDHAIAERVFANAVNDLFFKVESYPIDKIIIPIGHDFFQVNDWLGLTAAGTRVDSTDDRFAKIFEIGIQSMRRCITQCLEIAEVECIYVPGNHDVATSFYLCKVLQSAFESNRHVSIDTSSEVGSRTRKYRSFGRTLLGYIHGASRDCPRDEKLPLLMATEVPAMWGLSTDRAWRLGHLHTKRTSVVNIGNIFNGVRIERIPSLSGTDRWHFDNGFVGNRRAAEAWLWSKDNGLEAQFTTYAK